MFGFVTMAQFRRAQNTDDHIRTALISRATLTEVQVQQHERNLLEARYEKAKLSAELDELAVKHQRLLDRLGLYEHHSDAKTVLLSKAGPEGPLD